MVAPATLSVFNHLFASVAEEMGLTLGRAAYSPNIKERLDFSCALFLGDGRMLAQAAHIPVHLGAMPASVRAAIDACSPLYPGDVVILNDPYLGGTH
ncbi:MAG: hydantoinase B/oxoprolinase family protein, partial [Chloroflexota bacterium]